MNDDRARRLLAGIDAPRPLPQDLRNELLATLTTAHDLATADAPRPLPDDLRHRLEATLVSASARPLPSGLRRRVLSATTRTTPRALSLAAAAVLILVAGIALAVRPGGDDTSEQVIRRPQAPRTTIAGSSGGSGAGTSGFAEGSDTAGSGAALTPGKTPAGGGGSAAAPTAGTRSSGDAGSQPIQITVVSQDDSDIRKGFEAYLTTVNAAGGVNGRRVEAVEPLGGVAIVNVGAEVTMHDGAHDVVFESVWYSANILSGRKLSLSSPFEGQARLAVANAYPDGKSGERVALYSSTYGPWGTSISDTFEDSLEARGLTVIRALFNPSAPAYVPGVDAAFLALSPKDVSAWVNGAASAAPRGVWGIGSAYDDRLARRGESLKLRVLSPYRPLTGDEATALHNALPDHALTVTAVHGWVTAKAVVNLLRANGGMALTDKDLGRLTGWVSGWAPPFELRPGTTDRTPEAILLRPVDGRFVADGDFQRDR